VLIKQEPDEQTLANIKQFYVNVENEDWKLKPLHDLYETLAITQSVIFVNKHRMVDWLADKMRGWGYTVSAAHGDMDQVRFATNQRSPMVGVVSNNPYSVGAVTSAWGTWATGSLDWQWFVIAIDMPC
jgi:hypothetical protein